MASKQSFATESTTSTLGSSGSSYEDEIQPAPRPYTVPQSPTEVSVKSLYGSFHVAAHFPTYAPVHFGRHWDVASHHVCPASAHHPPPGAHTDNSPLCFPMTSYKHGAGSSRSNGGVLLDAAAAEAAKAAAAAAACAAVAAAAYAAAACADISDDDGAAANTLLGLRHQAFRGTCARAARVFDGSSSGSSSAQGYAYGHAFERSGGSSTASSSGGGSSGGGSSSGDDSRGDGGMDSDGDGDFYRGSAVAVVPRKRSIEALSAADVGGVSSRWARAPLPMRQHAA